MLGKKIDVKLRSGYGKSEIRDCQEKGPGRPRYCMMSVGTNVHLLESQHFTLAHHLQADPYYGARCVESFISTGDP